MAVFNEVYKQVVAGGLPKGGAPGQILSKKTSENYDAEWVDAPENEGTGGGVGESMTGKRIQLSEGWALLGYENAEIFNDYRPYSVDGRTPYPYTWQLSAGNLALSAYSHVENSCNVAYGECAHAEGNHTSAMEDATHTEGHSTIAYERYSHAEGDASCALARASHAEGIGSVTLQGTYKYYYHVSATNFPATTVTYSTDRNIPVSYTPAARDVVALFDGRKFVGTAQIKSVNVSSATITFSEPIESTSEILYITPSDATYSSNGVHAEGYYSSAFQDGAHAEGNRCLALHGAAHAEGYCTTAIGSSSHAQGSNCIASGTDAMAGGEWCYAEGDQSLAFGLYCTAKAPRQVALGYWNKPSALESDRVIVGKDRETNCFRITDTGTYASGNYNASGADYAELFQWQDGNPNNEDRVGLFVALDGEKIKLADVNSDLVLGIVSGSPSVVGDVYDDQWQGMYLVDIYGRPIMETVEIPAETIEVPDPEDPEKTVTQVIRPARTETRQKLNPDYDPSQKYVPRSQRPEWDAVGMLGKLVVKDDGTSKVNGYCYPGKSGIATSSKEPTPYRVMARLDETHIRVLILG